MVTPQESVSVKIGYDQNRGHSQQINFAHTFYIDRPVWQSNQNKVSIACLHENCQFVYTSYLVATVA